MEPNEGNLYLPDLNQMAGHERPDLNQMASHDRPDLNQMAGHERPDLNQMAGPEAPPIQNPFPPHPNPMDDIGLYSYNSSNQNQIKEDELKTPVEDPLDGFAVVGEVSLPQNHAALSPEMNISAQHMSMSERNHMVQSEPSASTSQMSQVNHMVMPTDLNASHSHMGEENQMELPDLNASNSHIGQENHMALLNLNASNPQLGQGNQMSLPEHAASPPHLSDVPEDDQIISFPPRDEMAAAPGSNSLNPNEIDQPRMDFIDEAYIENNPRLLDSPAGQGMNDVDSKEDLKRLLDAANKSIKVEADSKFPCVVDENGRRVYPCKHCSQVCHSKLILKKHLATQHEAIEKEEAEQEEQDRKDKVALCVSCNAKIKPGMVLEHMLLHPETKKYVCKECGLSFNKRKNLTNHLKIHNITATFSCDECSYTSNQKKLLKRHQKKHTDEKIHKCPKCSYSNRRRDHLLKHIKTKHKHVGVYKCTLCNGQFTVMDSFKVHVAMHAATKSTSCLICGVIIDKRPTLIEHLLSHGDDQAVSCNKCNKKCVDSSSCLLHYMMAHKGSLNTVPGNVKGNKKKGSDYDLVNVKKEPKDPTDDVMSKQITADITIECNFIKLSGIAEQVVQALGKISFYDANNVIASHLDEVTKLSSRMSLVSKRMAETYRHGKTIGKNKTQMTLIKDIKKEKQDADDIASYISQATSSIDKKPGTDVLDVVEYTKAMNMAYGIADNIAEGILDNDDDDDIDYTAPISAETPIKCKKCDFCFTSPRNLKRHMQSHNDVRPFPCTLCGSRFKRPEHLRRHVATHSSERKYKCPKCPWSANSEEKLKTHQLFHSNQEALGITTKGVTNGKGKGGDKDNPMDIDGIPDDVLDPSQVKDGLDTEACFDSSTGQMFLNLNTSGDGDEDELEKKVFDESDALPDADGSYRCKICEQAFLNGRNLKRHMLIHYDVRPHVCDTCGFRFKRPEHLKRHKTTHSTARPYKCNECSFKAKTETQLKKHQQCHTKNKKLFECDLCAYTTFYKQAMKSHKVIHEKKTCSQCPFVCESILDMKEHVFTHDAFFCTECDLTTLDKSEFAKHLRCEEKARQKMFLCEQCPFTTKNKKDLTTHRRETHEDPKEYICGTCGAIFNKMMNLRKHMRKLRHKDHSRHQCTLCDYKCFAGSSMRDHMNRHEGIKQHMCSTCGKCFVTKTHLKRHKMVHSDEKPHTCTYCSYESRSKFNLKQHMARHVKNEDKESGAQNLKAHDNIRGGNRMRHKVSNIRDNSGNSLRDNSYLVASQSPNQSLDRSLMPLDMSGHYLDSQSSNPPPLGHFLHSQSSNPPPQSVFPPPALLPVDMRQSMHYNPNNPDRFRHIREEHERAQQHYLDPQNFNPAMPLTMRQDLGYNFNLFGHPQPPPPGPR